MASVQKRTWANGETTYIVRWRSPDGKEHSKGGFKTKRDANAYATRKDNGRLTGVEFDPMSGGLTFREAAQQWLDSRHDLKVTTRESYRGALAPAAERRAGMQKLGIDAVFGSYPLKAITREQISNWIASLTAAGKSTSTVGHAYFLVRMVLAQAVADSRIPNNPADYVKLPTDAGNPGVVDDPAQFLTPTQVAALVAAVPWPYNVLVHVAAWSGVRAAEIAGLQVGDVDLPEPSLNPNALVRPGVFRVERTAQAIHGVLTYVAPKTRGSRRRVPMTPQTTAMVRDYLAAHPRADEPTAPLFPAFQLSSTRPTGVRNPVAAADAKAKARRQAHALADSTVAEHAARLVLDWSAPYRHAATFSKAVYRPAVLRAIRQTPRLGLSPDLEFHSLRHTYASLCAAAGLPPLEISRFTGHSKVTTTLGVYTHVFDTDDHTGAMAALGAMAILNADNVVRLRG